MTALEFVGYWLTVSFPVTMCAFHFDRGYVLALMRNQMTGKTTWYGPFFVALFAPAWYVPYGIWHFVSRLPVFTAITLYVLLGYLIWGIIRVRDIGKPPEERQGKEFLDFFFDPRA